MTSSLPDLKIKLQEGASHFGHSNLLEITHPARRMHLRRFDAAFHPQWDTQFVG
jgi:hypothetical protein